MAVTPWRETRPEANPPPAESSPQEDGDEED